MTMTIHHVQVCGPPGCEDRVRGFYAGVLGMMEVEKPEALRARGGAWFRGGSAELHVGIEDPFTPARKAHPALGVADVDALADRVTASGADVTWDTAIPGVRRFHTHDPVGNRIEIQQVG